MTCSFIFCLDAVFTIIWQAVSYVIYIRKNHSSWNRWVYYDVIIIKTIKYIHKQFFYSHTFVYARTWLMLYTLASLIKRIFPWAVQLVFSIKTIFCLFILYGFNVTKWWYKKHKIITGGIANVTWFGIVAKSFFTLTGQVAARKEFINNILVYSPFVVEIYSSF